MSTTWTAGARSIATLGRAGYFSFKVLPPSKAMTVGVSAEDASVEPYEPSHGFEFDGNAVWIFESGARRVQLADLGAGDDFHIVRLGDSVTYCRGATPTRADAFPFDLPGAVVHVSARPLTRSRVVLDAALGTADDAVRAAALVALDGAATLEPMPAQVYAGDPQSWAICEPMPGKVLAGPSDSAELVAHPAVAIGLSVAQDFAHLVPMPGTVLGLGQEAYDFGTAIARAATVAAGDTSGDYCHVEPEPGWVTGYLVPYAPETADMTVVVPFFVTAEPVDPSLVVTSDFVLEGEPIGVDGVFLVTSDVVLEGEGVPARVAGPLLVESEVRLADNPIFGAGVVVDSTLVLDSEAVASHALLVTDDLVLEGGPGELVGAVRQLVITDELVLLSEPTTRYSLDVTDELVLDDGVAVSAYLLADDAIVLDDEALGVGGAAPLLMVEDVVELVGEVAGVQVAAAPVVVEDIVVLVDEPLLRGQGLMAWVMNTETAGVSWYEAWPFTGAVQLPDGQVLAIGPDGLAVVGGDTDDGQDIDADIEMGYTDFSGYTNTGAPKNTQWNKQRVLSFWVGYRADGVLDAVVQTHGNRTYRYQLQRHEACTPRNSRIKPGKGLNERFWRVNFGNTCGCAFEINSLAAEVAASTRRI